MKFNLLKTLLPFLFTFIIISCRSTDDKIKDFAKQFSVPNANSQAGMSGNVTAEELPNRKIKLTFESDLPPNFDGDNGYSKTLANTFVKYLISNVKEVPNLVQEGVEFEVYYVAKDKSEISKAVINKKSIEANFKENQDKLLSKKPAENYVKSLSVDPSMREVMSILNKDLPFEDKQNGTTIVKIYINEQSQIVYDVKVTDVFAEVLKTDDGKNLVRDGMLRQPQLKGLLEGFIPLGVSQIKYNYMDKAEKTVAEIKLAKKDLL